MDIHELIIKAHALANTAKLAEQVKCEDTAWNKLTQLRELLNDQPELEAGGARARSRRDQKDITC